MQKCYKFAFRMNAFVPKVSWFLIKRSDQVKIIFETDDLDANSMNIGKVFAGIGYRKPRYKGSDF